MDLLRTRLFVDNGVVRFLGDGLAMSRDLRLGVLVAVLVVSLLNTTAALGQSSNAARSAELHQNAMTLEQQGRSAEADAAWQAYAKLRPQDAEAWAHRGFLAARAEQYPEAIALYQHALRLNPSLPHLRMNLGLACFKSGQMKQAAESFVAERQSQTPNSAEWQRTTTLAGMSYYGLHDYASAVPFLKEAAEADPANLPLRLSLAHSCLWSRQFPCVLEVYRQMLALNSESAEVDMLAGEAADEMKDRGTAVDAFRAAVKANPEQPEVHFGLGYLLWKQHQIPEAKAELEAELERNPGHFQAMQYMGDALMQLGEVDQARQWLGKALALEPRLWLAHLDLGIVQADKGEQEAALAQMQAAADLNPNEVNVHWRLGKLLKEMGRSAEARAEMAKANRLTQQSDESVLKKMAPVKE